MISKIWLIDRDSIGQPSHEFNLMSLMNLDSPFYGID